MTQDTNVTTQVDNPILQEFQQQLPKLEDYGYDPMTLKLKATTALESFLGESTGTKVFDESVVPGPLYGSEENAGVPMTGLFTLGDGVDASGQIRLVIADGKGDVYLASGKRDFDNTESGFILGIDDSDSNKTKFYIGNTTQYLNWDGTNLTITGTVAATAIDIGGADSTSFHVDSSGNMWLGAATFGAAPFSVTSAGVLSATSGSITGSLISGTISAVTITGSTITGSTLQTGTVGENVNITSAYISLRNGGSETGYLRGYQTTDRYGNALNASEVSVTDVRATRLHHPGMLMLDGGGGGTVDAAWFEGVNSSGSVRPIALLSTQIYITGNRTDSASTSVYLNGPITLGAHKTYDAGTSGGAWDDVWADDFQNVADFLLLDSKDDLAELDKIKGSGKKDKRTGIEMIDDDTVPEWLLTKTKNGKEIVYSEDGKPFIAVKTMLSLLMGAVRQLNKKVIALENK